MAEGSYEDACMRAELMGTEKPNYDEFMKRKREIELEEIETQQLQEAEVQNDDLKGTATKLDELNSILSKTQGKLNKMKCRCGSVTEMFKTKFGNPSKSKSSKSKLNNEDVNQGQVQSVINDTNIVENAKECANVEVTTNVSVTATNDGPRKSELSKALDYNMDKLDLLLDGAERAEMAMNSQNKQMKRYIKK